ncbi:hypothetical protein [Massilia sp. CF038]|uniref:hypothetical protein n=1 Tax=Massilia sp. CF038 TaxID=1881045 RepID=UPI0009115F6E|nr:hypothetical protein [Massilia sp. CF038]SHH01568.1 hypothetical protein SAMN05428948_2335 [Massilia sp. CF038]
MKALFGIGCALVLSACSTPKVAMDQANNTVGLLSQLDNELNQFRQVQERITDQSLASLRKIEVRTANGAIDTASRLRLHRIARDPVGPALFETVRDSADALARDRASAQLQSAEIDARLAKLMQPLPQSAQGIAAVQLPMAAMGTELSHKTRLAESRQFYEEVKAAVEANKKKIAEADNK